MIDMDDIKRHLSGDHIHPHTRLIMLELGAQLNLLWAELERLKGETKREKVLKRGGKGDE